MSMVGVRLEGRGAMVRVRGCNVRPRWQSACAGEYSPSTSTQKSQTLEKLFNVGEREERGKEKCISYTHRLLKLTAQEGAHYCTRGKRGKRSAKERKAMLD